MKLPRLQHQRWVYLSDESQWYSTLYPEYDTGLFNWTMSFHSSSDVPVPYGRVVRGTGRTGRDIGVEEKEARPELAAIMQSHCAGQSGRFSLLDRLVTALPGLHVWGNCAKRYNQSHPGCSTWAQRCPQLANYKELYNSGQIVEIVEHSGWVENPRLLKTEVTKGLNNGLTN